MLVGAAPFGVIFGALAIEGPGAGARLDPEEARQHQERVDLDGGVQRAGDGYCFAEGEVTKLYDPAFDAFYEAGTDLGLWHITTIGSGATAQLLVVQISSMFLGQKPTTPDDGGFVTQTHQWQALEDGQVVDPDTDLARAPIRIAILGGA